MCATDGPSEDKKREEIFVKLNYMFEFLNAAKTIDRLKSKLEEMTRDRDYERGQAKLYRDSKDESERKIREEHDRVVKQLKFDHDLALKQIKADHEIVLKTKQFEIDHHESEALKTAKDELNAASTKLAVAETKLEIMSKVTDVNADVLDVKDLVTKLIEKMPNINIDGIIAGLAGGNAKKPEGK